MSNQQHTPEPWRLGRFSGPASYEKVRETCGAMDVVVDTDTGPYVLAGCNINFPDDAKANASRIVACVNACAGIPTGQLESVSGKLAISSSVSMWQSYCDKKMQLEDAIEQRDELNRLCEFNQRTMDELLKQRDELLAALELCIPELRGWMNSHGEDIGTIAAIKAGKAAIASVKEKK